MRLLILGCDGLVVHLTETFANDGHTVTVMDTSPDRLDTLPRSPHVEAVLTTDSLMEDLRGVAINHVDAFLALSDDDNRNVLAAQVASHIFHVGEVICRVSDPERGKFYQGLGIKVVSPTLLMESTIKQAILARH